MLEMSRHDEAVGFEEVGRRAAELKKDGGETEGFLISAPGVEGNALELGQGEVGSAIDSHVSGSHDAIQRCMVRWP